MNLSGLYGMQYVRVAPDAAEDLAGFLGVAAAWIDELVIDLVAWPDEVRPAPRTARDGRLIPGDPLLLGATDLGLLFARRAPEHGPPVLVDWETVRYLDVVGRPIRSSLGVVCHP
jgi:hypothetical protein